MFKFYQVGGSVRDELLGRESKDIDYSVICSALYLHIDDAFNVLCHYLDQKGYTRFLTTPDCLTVRAKFPNSNEVADFVLARKEVGYYPGTRVPRVMPGTLEDDLSRRDFTVNAIAKDPDTGEYIDLFEGRKDLEAGMLYTPLNSMVTLTDDPLRAIRALRFAVVLGFEWSCQLENALFHKDLPGLTKVVSTDRIREELQKAFKHDTWRTLQLLKKLPEELVKEWFTRDGMWLLPTTKS